MRFSDIDLRLLRVFKAVADSGGFVKAQDVLGISQPAISAHIANLERRLGVRLAERGPQGFSLTHEGIFVLDETNKLLASIEASATRLDQIRAGSVERVRIGVVDCLVTDAANPLPAAIRTAISQQPDLTVSVGVYDYLDCLSELRAGHIDFAMVGIGADPLPDDLETQHIYDELSGLFSTPDHPCAQETDPTKLAKLLGQSKISAHSFFHNPIDESFDIHLLEENADVSQSHIESTAYHTLAGSHVGLIPLHYAEHWVKMGALVPIAPKKYQVVSEFHTMRLKSKSLAQGAQQVWNELSSGPDRNALREPSRTT